MTSSISLLPGQTGPSSTSHTLGVDVGSSFCKAVVCQGPSVRAQVVVRSGGNYKQSAWAAAEEALGLAGVAFSDLASAVATGYGAARADFCSRKVTDITCHALAMRHHFPHVRTVVDIGSQFSKAIRLDEHGGVADFILNEKCAGGSAKFLQVVAKIMNVDLERLGELSLQSASPVEFTTACAVFAESEVVSRIAEGASPADIVAGVHRAIAIRISNLVRRQQTAGDVAVSGGGGNDPGLVAALELALKRPVLVPPQPQFMAARGAALHLASAAQTLGMQPGFTIPTARPQCESDNLCGSRLRGR